MYFVIALNFLSWESDGYLNKSALIFEVLQDVKSDESSFRIHLIYTLSDASDKNQSIHESNGCYKRRKIGKFFPFSLAVLYFLFF